MKMSGPGRAGWAQRLECHYCGFQPDGARPLPQVRERAPLLPWRGFRAGRGAAGGDFPYGAHWPHGPRYGARALRSGTATGAAALGRDQPAGGHADDCQGARRSRHHAGGRGGLRPRALDAGLPRRRARLSVDDAGLGPCRARGAAGARGGADLLPRPLRHYGRQQARLHELRGARAEIPALDALPALRRAGQLCWCSRKSWKKRRYGRRPGQVFNQTAPEECACWVPAPRPSPASRAPIAFT